MDEYRKARRVLRADVSGGRLRGRARLGWLDGVKVVLGCKVGNAKVGSSRPTRTSALGVASPGAFVDELGYLVNFCLALHSFGQPSRALVDYDLSRGS